MSLVREVRVPSALAIASVVLVALLNDRPSGLFLSYCACIAGVCGFGFNSAYATYRRSGMAERSPSPLRSGMAIMTSLACCLIGLTLLPACFGYISNVLSSEFFNPMKDPPGVFAVLSLSVAALMAFCSGGVSLFYIAKPATSSFSTSIVATIVAIAATILWSVLSYPQFAISDSQSHAVGAGLGTFLFVVVFPSLSIFLLAFHLYLIRSLRDLIALCQSSATMA